MRLASLLLFPSFLALGYADNMGVYTSDLSCCKQVMVKNSTQEDLNGLWTKDGALRSYNNSAGYQIIFHNGNLGIWAVHDKTHPEKKLYYTLSFDLQDILTQKGCLEDRSGVAWIGAANSANSF